jgi:ParB family chromosome partitioning protein
MAKKAGLGRGLAALLGEEGEADTLAEVEAPAGHRTAGPSGIIDIPVGQIRRNPRQPRRAIDAASLDELAVSIAAVGMVQPVIVRGVEGGYELIAGERRWRAAQKAGFTVIPAIVRAASDVESLELALIENVVRQQLNPVEEAYALKVLLEDLGVTQESLAARVGKSRSAIANKVRLLDLPAAIQESLSSGALTEGHGRALLGLSEKGKQLQLARRVIDKGMSVRQVEDEVRRLTDSARATPSKPNHPLDPDLVDEIREAFLELLGIMPTVRSTGSGGVIQVPFQDGEDLRRLARRVMRP